MDKLIQDVISGLLLLSLLGVLQGLTKIMASKAVDAYKFGPMSYSLYTQELLK